jgi:hypothetical protein
MTNETTRQRLNELAKQLESLANYAYTPVLLLYAVRCFQKGYDTNPDIVQIAGRTIHRLANFISDHYSILSFDKDDIFADIFVLRSLSVTLKNVSEKPIPMQVTPIPIANITKLQDNLCDVEDALTRACEAANSLLQITQLLNQLKKVEE